jgi:hypothetical protein
MIPHPPNESKFCGRLSAQKVIRLGGGEPVESNFWHYSIFGPLFLCVDHLLPVIFGPKKAPVIQNHTKWLRHTKSTFLAYSVMHHTKCRELRQKPVDKKKICPKITKYTIFHRKIVYLVMITTMWPMITTMWPMITTMEKIVYRWSQQCDPTKFARYHYLQSWQHWNFFLSIFVEKKSFRRLFGVAIFEHFAFFQIFALLIGTILGFWCFFRKREIEISLFLKKHQNPRIVPI